MSSLEIIPYNNHLVEKARLLRKNSTPGEIELWKGLKGKRMSGYDFDRQKPILNYIVDFYCKELKLAIEVDGISHDYKAEYDSNREHELNEVGINILRFTEKDAKVNTDHCLNLIRNWIIQNSLLPSSFEGNALIKSGKTFRFY